MPPSFLAVFVIGNVCFKEELGCACDSVPAEDLGFNVYTDVVKAHAP
jgi:hypothetical protein